MIIIAPCPTCKCDNMVLVTDELPQKYACHCNSIVIIESTYSKGGHIWGITELFNKEKHNPLSRAASNPDDLMVKNRGERLPDGVMHFRGEPSIPLRKKTTSAADILDEAAATYRQRNSLYGGAYKQYGHVMAALFPDGLPPMDSLEDWNRFGVFTMIVGKVMRYATNLKDGGHRDSALDMSVYSAMLAEITMEKK